MTELTTEQLIKIILGVLVFVAVVLGIYLFFKENILDFFKNLGGNEVKAGVVLILLNKMLIKVKSGLKKKI